MIKVMKCTCQHEWQDKLRGKGNRVFNYHEKKNVWVCTVCGIEMTEPKKTKPMSPDQRLAEMEEMFQERWHKMTDEAKERAAKTLEYFRNASHRL